MVTLTINGLEVKIEKGSTLLEAAQFLGFPIPTLCHMEGLTPYGACRLCVVELEGARNPVASCTTIAAQGMVVNTATEAVEQHRKTLMELVVSENPAGVEVEELRGKVNGMHEEMTQMRQLLEQLLERSQKRVETEEVEEFHTIR